MHSSMIERRSTAQASVASSGIASRICMSQMLFEKGDLAAEIRAVGRDLDKAEAPVERDRRNHAGPMRVEPHPLVALCNGRLHGALGAHPADPGPARLWHDIEPLDLG